MERTHAAPRWRLFALIGAGAAALFLLRNILAALAVQLLAAAGLMLLALPLCRVLERSLPPGLAAVTALLLLAVMVGGGLLLILPPVIRQVQQLTAAFPQFVSWAQERWKTIALWLSERGMDVSPVKEQLFSQLTEQVGGIVSRVMGTLGQLAGAVGKMLLAPLLAFYLLRDRKRIAAALTLLLPVKHRAKGVRAAREMRRETAAYLRGQLLLSVAVAALTALALLLTGTPGWLLMGVLMGVLEMVPYVGPFIAGVPAVLLALQNGWITALWTVAALFLVQQAEGAFLSPRLLAGATQLHPMAVLLLVSAGGMLGGAVGMVLVIPVVVSVRGALRGWRA